MKRMIAITLACLSLGLVPGALAAQASPAPTCEPVDNALVEAQFKRFTDTWATGDLVRGRRGATRDGQQYIPDDAR